MKRFISVLSVLFFLAVVAAAFAGDTVQERLVARDQWQETFDQLSRVVYLDTSPITTKAITPTDTTGTNTHSVAWQSTVEPPFLLRIQSSGTGKIHYREYTTNSGNGVLVPTATNSYLVDEAGTAALGADDVFEKVFFSDPNIVFGGVAATFTLEIWTRSAATKP